MQVAAIYDIHASLPALEAVLQEMKRVRVDQVVVDGDVLPGPMPRETLARLLDLDYPVHFILGTGDREVLAQMAGAETEWYRTASEAWRVPVRWTAEATPIGAPAAPSRLARHLSPGYRRVGEVLFCHATPRNDTEVFTV